MKKTELVLVALCVISVILKMCAVDGAILLGTLTFCLLAILYFLFGFALLGGISIRGLFKGRNNANTSVLMVIWSVFAGIILSINVQGILFSINHWLGASMLLSITAPCLLVIAIASLVMSTTNAHGRHRQISLRAGSYFLLTAILLWLNYRR